jgi:hypothetical protein
MKLVANKIEVAPEYWRLRAANQDAAFANELTEDLPASFQRKILADYLKRYEKRPSAANVFLRLLVSRLKNQKIPLTAIATNGTAAAWAKRHARAALFAVANEPELFPRYEFLKTFVEGFGLVAPFAGLKLKQDKQGAARAAVACLKMTCVDWWTRQVKRFAARLREYLAISLGYVGSKKNQSPYASTECRAAYKKRIEQNKEFLENNYVALEFEDLNGLSDFEVISLAAASKAGVSNPEIRRLELMTRLRGMESQATALGMDAVFYTVTAPSKFHKNSKKWDGSAPRDAQKFLVNQWAKMRAEINDAKIRIAGMRVAEPHADATPHWHLLLFVDPAKREELTSIMRRYALQVDGDEKGAQANRFQAVLIDPTKGDAIGYIAKYISKNINAAHCETEFDEETGRSLLEGVDGVLSWASTHGIRQFQFIGGAPVTVWREMRRQRKELECPELEEIRKEADAGRFSEWLAMMGGLFVERGATKVKLAKEAVTSRYGELLHKVVGFCGFGQSVVTHKDWKQVGTIAAFAFALGQGASRAARSAGNNCKLSASASTAPEVQRKTGAKTQMPEVLWNPSGEPIGEPTPSYIASIKNFLNIRSLENVFT